MVSPRGGYERDDHVGDGAMVWWIGMDDRPLDDVVVVVPFMMMGRCTSIGDTATADRDRRRRGRIPTTPHPCDRGASSFAMGP